MTKTDRISVDCPCGGSFVVGRSQCEQMPGTMITCHHLVNVERQERCQLQYDPLKLLRAMNAGQLVYNPEKPPAQLELL